MNRLNPELKASPWIPQPTPSHTKIIAFAVPPPYNRHMEFKE